MTIGEMMTVAATRDAAERFDMDAESAANYLRSVESGLAIELAPLSNADMRTAAMMAAGVRPRDRVASKSAADAYNRAWVAECARLAAALAA
jgi:hypothetical protein